MWMAAVVVVLLAGYLAIEFRFFPPPWASVILTIRQGTVRLKKGRLPQQLQERVSEILAEEQIPHGFVAITNRQRILFSRRIPAATQQRMRNVLVNRWVD